MKALAHIIGADWAVPCDPPRSFDCWELVKYVRALGGKDTPDMVDRLARRPRHRALITDPPTGWHELDAPAPFCVVRFTTPHVGVFLPPFDVIHAALGQGVRVDRLRDHFERLTFWDYRHA